MLHRDEETRIDKRPARIGNFRVERELGRGGMGVVYLSRQEGLDRPVALKVLPLQAMAGPESAERFLREARAGAQLQHEGIAQVYESGRAEGHLYIAMEYVEGESLRARLDRGPVAPDDVAKLGSAVGRALHHAHEHGVVHRDVKPENVLVDSRGRPRVVDFGLAHDPSQPSLTVTGDLLGTPMYMSPEQAAGQRSVDARTDVYALGMTLYAMAAGRTPYDSSTPIARLLQDVQTTEPAPLAATVPVDLRTVIGKACEKDPARRYATCAAFADDLDRFLKREPILARPPGTATRVSRFLRRRPAVALLVLVAAAAMGAGIVALSRPGYLTVDASPRDAQVSIDGAVAGSPTRVPLTPGPHHVRVSRLGYTSATWDVVIERGVETRLAAALAREVGTLRVEASRECDLSLEGGLRLLPGVHTKLETGDHVLVVRERGAYVLRQTVRIEPGTVTRVFAVPTPLTSVTFPAEADAGLLAHDGELFAVGRSGAIARASLRGAVVRPWIVDAPKRTTLVPEPLMVKGEVEFAGLIDGALWTVARDGSSELAGRWKSEAFGGDGQYPRAAFTMSGEAWILGDAGLLRLDARTGARIQLHAGVSASEAVPLDGEKSWALLTEDAVEVREGPERVVARVTRAHPMHAAACDLDGDGRRDVLYVYGDGTLNAGERWSLPAVSSFCAGALRDGEAPSVVAIAPDGRVRVLDTSGRTTAEWKLERQPVVSPLLADTDADGTREVVVVFDEGFQVRDPRTGTVRDEAVFEAPVRVTEAALVDADDDGLLDLLLSTGAEGMECRVVLSRRAAWYQAYFFQGPLDAPSVGDGIVCVPVAEAVHAFDARTGRIRRQHPTACVPKGCAAWGTTSLLVVEADGTARCVGLDDGEALWAAKVPAGLAAPPQRAGDALAVFAGERIAGLASGAPRWSVDVRALDAFVNGLVYVAGADGAVHAIDPRDGKLAWRKEMPVDRVGPPSEGGGVTALLSTGRAVEFDERGGVRREFESVGLPAWCTLDGRRCAVRRETATRIRCAPLAGSGPAWTFEIMGPDRGEPVVAPGGRIALGSQDGLVRVLDGSTGRGLWSSRVGRGVLGLAAADGLIIAVTSGSVVALKSEGRRWTSRWEGPSGDRYRTNCVSD